MSGGEDTTDMSTEEVKEIQRSGLKSEREEMRSCGGQRQEEEEKEEGYRDNYSVRNK